MSDRIGPEPPAVGGASIGVADPPAPESHPNTDPALDQIASLCPFLIATPGDWRAAGAAREHTCGAVEPPVPVALDKQRRLCLGASHVECATYRAARRALVDDVGPTAIGERQTHRWTIASTAPVVIDRGGPRLSIRLDRTAAQIGLVGLMVLAFVVLGVARLSAGAERDASASPSPTVAPSPTASVAPSARPSPSPAASPSVEASPGGSVGGSAGPSGSVAPSLSGRTYTVQPGDTLAAIAAQYDTTVVVLAQLNGIDDPSLIHSGQVLQLP